MLSEGVLKAGLIFTLQSSPNRFSYSLPYLISITSNYSQN